MSNTPPTIEDDPGSADEWFARVIIILPFALLLLGGITAAVIVSTGMVTLNYSITGTISIGFLVSTVLRPVLYVFGGLMGAAYLLAMAKEWGLRPLGWLLEMAANYNPRSAVSQNGEGRGVSQNATQSAVSQNGEGRGVSQNATQSDVSDETSARSDVRSTNEP